MRDANVDLVRSMYAAWERGDFSSAAWAAPDIEFVMTDGPAPGSWKGLPSMAQGWRDWLSAWKDIRIQPETHEALDAERVLTLVTASGYGKTSGLELGQMRATGATVIHIGDGKATRFMAYWDRERAFADLGLSPEADLQ